MAVKSLVLFAFGALLLCTAQAIVTDGSWRRSRRTIRKLSQGVRNGNDRKNVAKAGNRLLRSLRKSGCKMAACMAMEGGRNLAGGAFRNEKLLVALVGAVVMADSRVSLGSVQYSTTTTPVTPVTTSYERFQAAVARTTQSRSTRINLSGGLAYCWFQVRQNRKPKKRVVILGTGTSTIGFPASFIMRSINRGRGTDNKVIGVLTRGSKQSFVNSSIATSRRDVLSFFYSKQLAGTFESLVRSMCDL